MGLISPDKIAEIRDRTDIVSVIGEFVSLRRSGSNHVGLCPFHTEKTPSFNVSATKQFFYCFGCQKSGDVFRFLMELEGRSFAEVARDLARRAGVEIPEEPAQTPAEQQRRREAADERSRLLRLCDIVCSWFEGQLQRSPRAQEYLARRGINETTRRVFRLGYAPEGWDALQRYLEQRGVPWELYEKAGLGIRREGAALPPPRSPATRYSHYDRFRDRIIFPLITPAGEVVAFAGRALPREADEAASSGGSEREVAKYINSPESLLYKKGEHLYGLHAARDAVRKSRQVILVEGNFDVLSLHQRAINNAVAPMGTALTATQVRLLKRLLGPEGHVVLMLDGDRAGRSATLKDIWLFTEANVEDVAMLSGHEVDVRVAQLPDGEDPDTYAARDLEGMVRRIRAAKPAVDYVLDEAIKLAEHDSIAGKAKVLMKVVPLLKAIPNRDVQEMYVAKLAMELGLEERHIWRRVRGSPSNLARPAPTRSREPSQQQALRLDPIELQLVALCGDHPHLCASLPDDLLDRLSEPALGELLREARELGKAGEMSAHQLVELAPPELRGAVARAALGGQFAQLQQPETVLSTICAQLRIRAIEREEKELLSSLGQAQRAQDEQRVKDLLKRILDLQHERRAIRQGGGPAAWPSVH
ncbi:MAG: DNA primase [Myxococcales bacterium]|nr:DNA primase [Myxococcota bacterium]MDW8283735.1 DNA primase [Myxococcales bacterium]